MSQRYVNINGKILSGGEAGIPVDDRSFRYGYGLFETMLLLDGAIRHEELHWARLERGLAALEFRLPARFAGTLRLEVGRLLARTAAAAAMRIRLQVTAGSGGYFDAADWKPFFVIECWPLPEWSPLPNENGLVIGIAAARKEPGPYSEHKTTNALCYAMAAREAKRAGWNDAILLNAAGNLVESCISNVFVRHEGRLITPPLSDGCVDGVMRRVLLERFEGAGMPVFEESISPKMLSGVEGMFLTNAIRGISWVQTIEGLELSPYRQLPRVPLPL